MSGEHVGFTEDELVIRHASVAARRPNPLDWWDFDNNPLWAVSEEANAYTDVVLCLDDAENRDQSRGQANIWWRARVKWDGCVDLYDYANIPYDLDPSRTDSAIAGADCYIHICDVDRLIERLQALKALALAHFGKDWPNA